MATTDNLGTTTGTQRFDAWGNKTASTGTIATYGYTGREPDATGLMYYRARYYDPSIGRFTQRDPIGLRGGINRYAYVENDPTNVTDPTGEIGEGLLAKLAAKGIQDAEKLFARAKLRIQSLRDIWNRAPDGPTGGKLCETCGKEVTVPPGSGKARDWHGDHYPEKSAEIINKAAEETLRTGVPPSRNELLDKLNDTSNLRVRCPECNMSDNQLSAVVAGGGVLSGNQSSGILGTGITWRDVGEFVLDLLVSPGSAEAPTMPTSQSNKSYFSVDGGTGKQTIQGVSPRK
ncbi:MAG: RHS repeat-associated core domain-containing protein [Gammaproteobacteria bacterium]|nr:RHS repeat-associated core domain-containing protein [Gammaproteobacteria bacterium]